MASPHFLFEELMGRRFQLGPGAYEVIRANRGEIVLYTQGPPDRCLAYVWWPARKGWVPCREEDGRFPTQIVEELDRLKAIWLSTAWPLLEQTLGTRLAGYIARAI